MLARTRLGRGTARRAPTCLGGALCCALNITIGWSQATFAATPPSPVTAATLARTTSPEPFLALAFVSDTRLLALSASTVMLLRTDVPELTSVVHLALDGPLQAVRAPAGLLVVDPESDAAWIVTNRSVRTWLVAWSDDRLSLRAEAEAAPVPGSKRALRYREGTNWIEGSVPHLGSGPFLAIELAERDWAVTTSARLLSTNAKATKEEGERPRVGPTLAALWPGWVAASTDHRPGSGDALLILARHKGAVREVAALPTDESIRALASRRVGTHMRLAVASETAAGATRLILLELKRSEP